MRGPAAERLREAAFVAAGVVLLLGAWEVVGRAQAFGPNWPPLTETLAALVEPNRRALLVSAAGVTLREAMLGYAFGLGIAGAFACVGRVLPPAEEGLSRLVVFVNAVPVIALSPILTTLAPRSAAPVIVALIASLFACYVSLASGLAGAAPVYRDVFSALGSSRGRRLVYLDAPSALPTIAAGMKLAAPAAVLGALIGEWFGATSGLGVMLITGMQNYDFLALWSTALVAVGISTAVYGALSGVSRAIEARFA